MRTRTNWYMAATAAIGLLTLAGCQSDTTTANTTPDTSAEKQTAAKESNQRGEPKEQESLLEKIIPGPPTVDLPQGTLVKVRTTTSISTKTHEAGDDFVATLAAPVSIDGWLVAPRGATVRGKVITSDDGGKVKGRANMSIRLTQMETADQKFVDISTNAIGREAPGTKKKDATKIGIGSGVGAAIGAIAGGGKGAAIGAAAGAGAGTGVVMATRGAAAVIPAETVLTFRLQAPLKTKALRKAATAKQG